MARDKQKPTEQPEPSPTVDHDGGAAEVQARADEAEANGYFGWSPDPHPNSAYSLASGPNAPAVNTRPKERN